MLWRARNCSELSEGNGLSFALRLDVGAEARSGRERRGSEARRIGWLAGLGPVEPDGTVELDHGRV